MSVEHIDAMTGEILPSLAECEETIARGVRGYVEAGEALRTIRDARLYRETHGTFEDYCRERWGWTRMRAHQLIEASDVNNCLQELGAPAPANEGQARELVGLPAETAAQIMRTAAETGQTITARVIRETRVQIAGSLDDRPGVVRLSKVEPRRRPLVDSADDAGWDLTKAVEKLGRVMGDDRYHHNENEVATRLRSHLMNAIEVCQDLLTRLPSPNEQENQS